MSAYFSEEYDRFVKPTKQMKLCKSPEEQLYRQREHEPTPALALPENTAAKATPREWQCRHPEQLARAATL